MGSMLLDWRTMRGVGGAVGEVGGTLLDWRTTGGLEEQWERWGARCWIGELPHAWRTMQQPGRLSSKSPAGQSQVSSLRAGCSRVMGTAVLTS